MKEYTIEELKKESKQIKIDKQRKKLFWTRKHKPHQFPEALELYKRLKYQ